MYDAKKEFLAKKFNIPVEKAYSLIAAPTINIVEEEADRFITCIVDESTWKNYARVEKMNQQQKNIRHLGFGHGKFMFPAGEFDESKYKKQFAHNKIQLQTQEIRGAVAIFDSDLEDLPAKITPDEFTRNITKDIVAPKIANEIEFAAFMSDTASYNGWCSDDIESLWDGWRYIITNAELSTQAYYNTVCGASHIKRACKCESGEHCESAAESVAYDDFQLAGQIIEFQTSGAYMPEVKYGAMLKNMPAKYKKVGLGNLTFINNDLVTEDYLFGLEQAGIGQGGLSDEIIKKGWSAVYHGVPIINAPLYPTDLGSDSATPDYYGIIGGDEYTDVYLTPKNNFIIGIQKDITIEPFRSPSDRATYMYYTMRIAFAVENVNAVVMIICLTHRC